MRATRSFASALAIALVVMPWPAPAFADRLGVAGDAAWGEVQRLIGQAACKSDADCRSVAVGSRACGGPQRYLAWSATQTDAQALAAALERAAAQQAAAAGKAVSPLASTCVFIADPGARCLPAGGPVRQCALGGGGDAR